MRTFNQQNRVIINGIQFELPLLCTRNKNDSKDRSVMMVDMGNIIGWKRLRYFGASFKLSCLYFPLWLMNKLMSSA